ncbi:lactate utilization protein [Desulfovibrio aminophilus]|nr:lactate utilization protein [Desulfovibrio aminophilus]MCM0754841.1 lactate utilization protein [Desulfovibrio aminophilus]
MNESRNPVELFEEKAKAVSALVTRVASMREAVAYALDVCDTKQACQLLVSGCSEPLSEKGQALCETKQQKVIAAPGLPPELFAELEAGARERGVLCVEKGMREHLGGVDIGFTLVDFGIAETGTLVINSNSEELRLATMIAEFHVAVLSRSKIRETSRDLEAELAALTSVQPSYTAFVTGASRTADIERVLALGVHGPLELHILLLED